MRDLSTDIYEARVKDGNELHILYYRRPTSTEHAAYAASAAQRRGGKIINRMIETRLKFGARVLTGFQKGTFGFQGQAIASEPEDQDFYPDWKNLLVKAVPDIVAAIGREAFEGTQVVSETETMDFDAELQAVVDEFDEVAAEEDPSSLNEK